MVLTVYHKWSDEGLLESLDTMHMETLMSAPHDLHTWVFPHKKGNCKMEHLCVAVVLTIY